jgi:hypothetical protein
MKYSEVIDWSLGVDLHGYSILQEWRLRTANFLRSGSPIRLVRDSL